MAARVHSFPPIGDARSALLVLGTMPSEASLQQGFYYAHPRNCFWPMLSEILGEPAPDSIDRKRQLLLGHRIALWDVAQSCQRQGSLDSAIREAVPNDIEGLLARCPRIGRILFNGGAAQRLFRRLLPPLGAERRLLPSTSPAYTLPYEKKRAAWAAELRAALLKSEHG